MNAIELYPRPYVKGADLQGKSWEVTVRDFSQKWMHPNSSGKPENKWVMFFENTEKGLIWNRTLNDQMVALHGPEVESWLGKKVRLYPVLMKVAGIDRVAIRIQI